MFWLVILVFKIVLFWLRIWIDVLGIGVFLGVEIVFEIVVGFGNNWIFVIVDLFERIKVLVLCLVKFVVVVIILYLFGVIFVIVYKLVWLVIVCVIGVRFWDGKIRIDVLEIGLFVNELVIFFVNVLGFGWRRMLIVVIWLEKIWNFIVFFWKLEFVIINV